MESVKMGLVPEASGVLRVRDNLPDGMAVGDAALVRVTGVGPAAQPVLAAFDYQMGDKFVVVRVG